MIYRVYVPVCATASKEQKKAASPKTDKSATWVDKVNGRNYQQASQGKNSEKKKKKIAPP